MGVVINTKVGINRGQSRIWIEGKKLAMQGIKPSMKWALNVGKKSISVSLYSSEDEMISSHDKTGSVSARTLTRRDGSVIQYPVIEFRSELIASVFSVDENIKVSINGTRITITPQQTTLDVIERRERFLNKLINNIPLSFCTEYHGGGVLDKATHHGLKKAGVASFIQMAVELENSYLESSLRNNAEMWRSDSLIFQGGIEFVNCFDQSLPKVDWLLAGIPCTGASIAGRSKNKIAQAEDHKDAGALFFYTLNTIIACNPAIVELENVSAYANTASMSVIRSVLESRGYILQERIIGGAEFGALEDRERLCVLAITQGMEHLFDLNTVVPMRHKEPHLSDVLDNIPLDSAMYKERAYLEEKAKRDKEKGNSFQRQLVTPDATKVGTIGKGYAKGRGTECMLIHPEDPKLSRLLTVAEHARVKTIPLSMTDGCSDTVAHEIMGQSVIFAAFYAIAYQLGAALITWKQQMQSVMAAA